jgi:hypothetical protein
VSPDHAHLDAETLAAWMDGGLDAPSTAAAEAHVSNCERCQAMVATFARTEAPGTVPVAHGTKSPGTLSLWRWWLAPIAATAAAVTIWMVAPQPPADSVRQSAPAVAERKAEPAPPAGTPAEQQASTDTRAPSAKLRRETVSSAENRAQDLAPARDQELAKGTAADRVARLEDSRQRADAAVSKPAAESARAEASAAPTGALAETVTVAPAAPGAQAAAPPPALQSRVGPMEIVSPSSAFRWRVYARGSIERSEDGGRAWFPIRLGAGETLTAGSSPSQNVCWIVGGRGVVLIAVDGVSFVRLPFPHEVDLVAITASDGRTATVTAADGRTFTTTDSGRTWR